MPKLPNASLQTYLIATVCVIAVPMLIFVALLLQQLEESDYRLLERRAIRDAESIAISANQILRDMTTTLNLISSDPELLEGELALFHRRTQSVLTPSQQFVVLVDRHGQQLLNTRVEFGTPLGKTSNIDALQMAMTEKRVTVSDVFLGQTSGRWVFNVILPLEPNKSGAAAAIVTKNVDDFNAFVDATGSPQTWSVAILDSKNRIVSTSDDPDRVGESFSTFPLKPVSRWAGTLDTTLDDDLLAAYATIPGSNWKVLVWGSVSAAQSTIDRTWFALSIGGIFFLLVGIGVASLLGRQIRNGIDSILAMTDDLAEGKVVPPVETPVREIAAVSRALTDVSYERWKAEGKADLVLRELTHRLKNLLAVLTATLNLSARRTDSVAHLQAVLQRRLQGIGTSIEILTAREWSAVPLSTVAENHLQPFVPDPSRIGLIGEDIDIQPDAVQDLGIVFHELATNAVKYGSWSSQSGKVTLRWDLNREAEPPSVTVEWIETGGPPPKKPANGGFGSQITGSYARSAFFAEIEQTYSREGFRWKMTAPLGQLASSEPEAGRPEL